MIIYRKNRPKILMYHSIANNPNDPYSVTTAMFKMQINYLLKNKYDIISLQKLVSGLKKGNSMKNKIVITFDDGYKNFITNAFPILKEYKIPATVFLVFDLVGKKANWNNDIEHLDIMSKVDVKYIKKNGISLGGHTLKHTDLTTLNTQQLHNQMVKSKRKLKEFGEKYLTYSYPWGRYSKGVINAMKNEGFDCALIAKEKILYLTDSLYQLGRITMQKNMSINLFKKEIEGRNPVNFTLNKIKAHLKTK